MRLSAINSYQLNLFLLFFAIIFFSCCSLINPKEETEIKKYIKENFDDPSEYESVSFGKLDSVFVSEFFIPETIKGPIRILSSKTNLVDTAAAVGAYSWHFPEDPLNILPEKIETISGLYAFFYDFLELPQPDTFNLLIVFPEYRKRLFESDKRAQFQNNFLDFDRQVVKILIEDKSYLRLEYLFHKFNPEFNLGFSLKHFFDNMSKRGYRVNFYNKYKRQFDLGDSFDAFQSVYGFSDEDDFEFFKDKFWIGYKVDHSFRLGKICQKKLFRAMVSFDKEIKLIDFNYFRANKEVNN